MKLGIVGAMPEEIALLRRDLANPLMEKRGMRDYWKGSLYGEDVVLVFSRWGKVAAASTVTTLIEVFSVDCVLFTGVAGALSPDLEIGDIVIGDCLMQHDLDASGVPGLKPFEVPLLGLSRFPVKKEFVESAKRAAERYVRDALRKELPAELLAEFGIHEPKIREGLIVSGDQFIAKVDALEALRRALPDALCVEMEGAAAAQVCYEHEIPMLIARVISDKADHSAGVDFPAFVDRVASHFTSGIVRELLSKLRGYHFG